MNNKNKTFILGDFNLKNFNDKDLMEYLNMFKRNNIRTFTPHNSFDCEKYATNKKVKIKELTANLINSNNIEEQMIGWFLFYQPKSNTAKKLIRNANRNSNTLCSIKDISKADRETFKKFMEYGAF